MVRIERKYHPAICVGGALKGDNHVSFSSGRLCNTVRLNAGGGRGSRGDGSFLSRHREALTQRPVAIFALGPFHSPIDEKEWQYSREQLEKELAQFPWLTPVALELFGGKMDPAKLRFPYNLPANPLKQMPPTDIRDWTAIRTWASNLAATLQPAVS